MAKKENIGQFEQVGNETFRSIVEPFLKYPEHLEVDTFFDADTLVIEPRANYADHGKLIGKDKANFNAIGMILFLIGERMGRRIRLNNPLPAIRGEQEFLTPYERARKWKSDEAREILDGITARFTKDKFEIRTREDEDEGRTFFHVVFSSSENLNVAVGQVGYSLSKIMHAIGRARGRLIYVSAEQKK